MKLKVVYLIKLDEKSESVLTLFSLSFITQFLMFFV